MDGSRKCTVTLFAPREREREITFRSTMIVPSIPHGRTDVFTFLPLRSAAAAAARWAPAAAAKGDASQVQRKKERGVAPYYTRVAERRGENKNHTRGSTSHTPGRQKKRSIHLIREKNVLAACTLHTLHTLMLLEHGGDILLR